MNNCNVKHANWRFSNSVSDSIWNFIMSPMCWNYAYLIILSLFLLHYFPQTIQYPSTWPRINYNYIHNILIVYVILKHAFLNKVTLTKKESVLFLLLLLTFSFSTQFTGYAEVFDTALLIVGAKDVYYKHILRIYLLIKIPLIIATIVASQTGLIEDLIYNQNGRIREAFGFIYPTDFAAQIFFVFVAWMLLRQLKISFIELGFMAVVAFLLKKFCDARCSVTCILLTLCFVILLRISKKNYKDSNLCKWAAKWFRRGCIIAPYIFGGTMILLCRYYNPDNPIMRVLNNVTSQRLRLGKKTFDTYDVKLFGQYIEMWGNGGSTQKPLDYTFIDCSYINILMRFGLLVFGLILILITFVMLQNYKNLLLLGLIVFICLHSMMEHHLFEINYNIIIVLPFSLYTRLNNTKT